MGHSIGHIYQRLIERWGTDKIRSYFHKATADNMPYGDPGVVTTNKRKHDYASSLRQMMVRNFLVIWKDLVVANRFIENVNDRYAETWSKLEEQFSRFRVVTLESDRPGSTTKAVISGVTDRTGKKNASENDDLAFSMSFAAGTCDGIFDGQLEDFDYSCTPWNIPNS